MEDNPRLLWGYVEVALRPLRASGETGWRQTLNRVYGEALAALGLPPGPELSRESCAIANEHWPSARVAATPRPAAPAGEAAGNTPMLVVRRRGQDVLIVGAGRAERIVRSGAAALQSVVGIDAPD